MAATPMWLLYSGILWPLYLGKIADWSTSSLYAYMTSSRGKSREEMNLLKQQQRTIEMMEYQLIYLTREMRKMHLQKDAVETDLIPETEADTIDLTDIVLV
jgi:hypothetical protein